MGIDSIAAAASAVSVSDKRKTFVAQDLDGNASAGTQIGAAFNVREKRNFSITAQGTAWTTAVVEVKWSVDGTNWYSFDPAVELTAAAPAVYAVDVRGIPYVAAELTTAEGSSNTISLQAYADNLP